MTKTLSSIHKITLSAMLLVLDVLATRFLRTPLIGNMHFIRISLGPAVVIFSSLLLGPLYGAIVGSAGDMVGHFLFPMGGQFNPLITIVYLLLGILPWCLMQFTSRIRDSLKKPYFLIATMALLLVLLVCFFYVIPGMKEYFAKGFGDKAYWVEPLIIALTALFTILACVGLFYLNRYFEKNRQANSSFPSPYETALICLISEVTLMVGLMPLAFYIFYNFISHEFPISYGTLLSCICVFSGIKVVLNTFVVYWLLVVTKKYLIKGE